MWIISPNSGKILKYRNAVFIYSGVTCGRGEGAECPQRLYTGKFLATKREKWDNEKRLKNGKCWGEWGKMEKGRMKIRRKIEKKMKRGRMKMKNVRPKGTEKNWGPFLGNQWNFFGSTTMDILTGKRLKSRFEKIGKSNFAPQKKFPVTPLFI